jgi:thiol-disulfide isomerase/thioredoxin
MDWVHSLTAHRPQFLFEPMKKSSSIITLCLIVTLFLVACSRSQSPATSAPADLTQGEEVVVDAQEEAVASDDATPPSAAPKEENVAQNYEGKVPAPEFPEGLDWLNTDRPLTLAELKGKIVLLDFWTYGCINCMHIIPDLKRLEEKYADELVVIGVHSAKFENESETDNIRRVILRYELEHPVINDKDFLVWSQYGAQAWPTLVLIDPDGKVLGYHSGEGIYGPFDTVIGGMVEAFDAQGKIDRTPLDLSLEQDKQVESPLRFPGKVLADANNDRFFIADSNHNRIVITDLDGNVLDVIGNGRTARIDGSYEEASFFRPQGLALAGDQTLYVADTENHVIRRVDLETRQVETVAGTGQQVYSRATTGDAMSTPLNSPWDVLYHDGLLYIAMAGQHQVWRYDPATATVAVHAGSGREELKDGPLQQGGLNQPSGLATDGQLLFIADSEASAIRTADLDPEGQLATIVGVGLFDFGDVDGAGDEVRLQHPLGVVYQDGLLYVADTYNSKIKLIDPRNRQSKTLLGGAEAGWRDGSDPLFDEPGGLSVAGNKLYVADTNNHVIRVADLDTKEVQTLVLVDMDGQLTRQPAGQPFNGQVLSLEPQTLAEGEGTVRLEVKLPEGYKVNDLAPFSMEWVSSNGTIRFEPDVANQRIVEPGFPLTFPATFSQGQGELTGELVIYYCEAESESLCFIDRVRIEAPVTVAAEGNEALVVERVVEAPLDTGPAGQ